MHSDTTEPLDVLPYAADAHKPMSLAARTLLVFTILHALSFWRLLVFFLPAVPRTYRGFSNNLTIGLAIALFCEIGLPLSIVAKCAGALMAFKRRQGGILILLVGEITLIVVMSLASFVIVASVGTIERVQFVIEGFQRSCISYVIVFLLCKKSFRQELSSL